MMKSVVNTNAIPLIIGYGNPLRGDDAIGQIIATQLQERLDHDQTKIIICQQLTFELAEDIAKTNQVILIDAAQHGIPGSVHTYPIMPSASNQHNLHHHVTPETLITTAYVLYGAIPPATLVSITGKQWEAGAGLSSTVQVQLPHLIKTVEQLLEAR